MAGITEILEESLFRFRIDMAFNQYSLWELVEGIKITHRRLFLRQSALILKINLL